MEVIFFPFVFLTLLIPIALSILSTVFWIWMIVDCAVNEPSHDNNKVVWILIIIFTHFIGALIYFLARRQQRIMEYGR
jgi:hypothetical protein